MPDNLEPPETEALNVGNYCVSFVDLLGQRAALQGQGLLPPVRTEEEKKTLHATLRKTIGSIATLQRRAEDFVAASRPNPNSELRGMLPLEKHAVWDQMQKSKITTQRWSDGLVSFACLGDQEIKCHLNNVFALFGQTGSLCFMGLASKRPIRGAIEVAWGVELHPGELYGAAIARAYELESEVADYPRIVIGPEMLRFLDVQCRNPNDDPFAQTDRELAVLCRNMIVQDADGHFLLHYLGETFRQAITNTSHRDLYSKAHAFVVEQLCEHQVRQNTKLAFRYVNLLQYFDAHPPSNAPF